MPSHNFTVLLSFVRKAKIHYLILTKRKNSHYTLSGSGCVLLWEYQGYFLKIFLQRKTLGVREMVQGMKELVRHAGTTGIRFLNLRVEGSSLNSVS